MELRCNDSSFAPNANRMVWMLTAIRVYSDINSTDDMDASEVIAYIGGEMGWDTSGVATSTFDVLPFDWQDGSWLDAMLYLAEIEDKFVRVGGGSTPLLEYGDWGTTNWNVNTTDGADPDLKPLEVFNEAHVWHTTASGVRRKQVRTTADVGITDPLATSGLTNVVEYELEDRQRARRLHRMSGTSWCGGSPPSVTRGRSTSWPQGMKVGAITPVRSGTATPSRSRTGEQPKR